MGNIIVGSQLLDAQSDPIQAVLPYYLVLPLVEEGIIQPVRIIVSENGILCIFEMEDGDLVAAIKPRLSPAEESQARRVVDRVFGENSDEISSRV